MPAAATRRERWSLIALRAWAVIGIAIIVLAVGWLLSAISSALVPFALGLVVVLMLRRPVELLSRRIGRTGAVAVCYLGALVVVALALTFLIPPMYAQILQFVSAVPDYTQQAFRLWDTVIVHPTAGSGVPAWLQSAVIGLKDQLVSGAGTWSAAIAQGAVSAGSSFAAGVVAIVLGLMVGFYTLVDLPRLEREIFVIAGERSHDEVRHALSTITRVLGGWIRGTLIQSTVVAVLITVGLAIVGVPYPLAIGVIAGMLNIVPYLGPAITAILAAAAGLFISPWAAVWAVVIVFAVQQLDSLVMAPRIMSEQVDLHPLMVIFSLLVGATLFGVPGMVLSVPVSAVFKGLFVYWYETRAPGHLSSEEGAIFRSAKEADDASDTEIGLDDPYPGTADTDALDR